MTTLGELTEELGVEMADAVDWLGYPYIYDWDSGEPTPEWASRLDPRFGIREDASENIAGAVVPDDKRKLVESVLTEETPEHDEALERNAAVVEAVNAVAERGDRAAVPGAYRAAMADNFPDIYIAD